MDISEDIELWHPKLKDNNYKIISTDKDLENFNCVAFVLDIYNYWCGSSSPSWPYDKIDRIPSLENYVKYFNMFGYEESNNVEFEKNYDKIAIYIDRRRRFTHVSKQFGNKWRSKLGGNVIIEHELEWLTGFDADNYGEIGAIMKRNKI